MKTLNPKLKTLNKPKNKNSNIKTNILCFRFRILDLFRI